MSKTLKHALHGTSHVTEKQRFSCCFYVNSDTTCQSLEDITDLINSKKSIFPNGVCMQTIIHFFNAVQSHVWV